MKNMFFVILVLTIISLPVFSQEENTFGIWTVINELDEFGDPTGEKYITTLEPIRGTFSNSANNNASLNVTIKIISKGNSKRVIITPYLGARNVPGIPFGSRREYSFAVRDNTGETFRSRVYLSLDNIDFEFYNVLQENFTIMHNAFLKGGLIRIRMETHENERNKESYSFDISNANQYSEAYAYLLSKQ